MDNTLRKSWSNGTVGNDSIPGTPRGSDWTALGKSWRQWTDWVGLFATHEPGRLATRGRDYESLHSRLLNECGALLAGADEAQRQRLLTMGDLARPWMTPSCLDHADREILGDLWRRCHQVDLEINGPDYRVAWRRLRMVLACVLGALMATALILLMADVVLDPILQYLEDGWRTIRITLRRTTAVEWWQGVGGACLVIAFFVLLRAIRK